MENEDEKIIKCFICQMEIDRLEYYRNHYDECRRKNTIRALDNRRKQTYIKDGKKYRILDIERVLLEHPLIAEIAVVGLPDETWGEKVAAIVVLREIIQEEVSKAQNIGQQYFDNLVNKNNN
jgi:acyl-CoA synthetase (AMP-forming)/AMP-acid ligase II